MTVKHKKSEENYNKTYNQIFQDLYLIKKKLNNSSRRKMKHYIKRNIGVQTEDFLTTLVRRKWDNIVKY